MQLDKLNDMKGGWIIGQFHPAVMKTSDFEVAIKTYVAGDFEKRHYHKIATEYTIILSGKVRMNKQEFVAGDIITVNPGEVVEFFVLENTMNCVVKVPSVPNDKYIV